MFRDMCAEISHSQLYIAVLFVKKLKSIFCESLLYNIPTRDIHINDTVDNVSNQTSTYNTNSIICKL